MPNETDSINFFKTEPDKVLSPVEKLANVLILEVSMMMLARVSPGHLTVTVVEMINQFLAQRDKQS